MLEINNEHLKELENEAIFVMREVAAQFENKVLLFSGGKDSIVLVHLARKAFWPARIPFTLLHIDTGHNFEETLKFRDDLAREFNADLVVKYVQDSIDQGRVTEEQGINASRNKAQSVTLLDAIEELQIDVAIGGGRRDEEKATGMNSGSGIQRTRGLNSGTFSTVKNIWGSISGFSPSATGRNWMSGNIYLLKISGFLNYITPTGVKFSAATVFTWPGLPS
jgi:hypothetical protein